MKQETVHPLHIAIITSQILDTCCNYVFDLAEVFRKICASTFNKSLLQNFLRYNHE